MIFLIDFDRKRAEASLQSFEDEQKQAAQEARAALEMDAGFDARGREIVLIESSSREMAMATHRRYFEKIMSAEVFESMLDNAKPTPAHRPIAIGGA